MASIPTVAQAWRLPVDQSTWDTHKSLQLRDVKISFPKRGEVLIRLHAAALNYRSQSYARPSGYSTGPDDQGLILTCDGAGEIVALGEGVTEWKKGDRVHSLFYETWLDGPFKREYMNHTLGGTSSGCLLNTGTLYRIFTAESLLPIPTHLSYEEASTIPCAALTAWHAFFEKQPINNNSTVLVLGSGGVSVFGAQLAKAAGARVIATTSSKSKAEQYKSLLGVDEVVNYRELPEWSTKVMELTGGEGVEQVLEVGGQGTILHSVKSIKPNGLVHVIGVVAGSAPPSGSVAELGQAILSTPATVSGIMVGSKAMCERLDAFMTQHKIKPVIDRVFGWNEVVEALDYQLTGGHFGKIVIKID
ncbi:zinc-type alcohol dehydrogenase-like protein [Rhizoctonia solani]|nr:zinc-type alcohol dehydrogenase-like protein [Rhizoctonia solani]